MGGIMNTTGIIPGAGANVMLPGGVVLFNALAQHQQQQQQQKQKQGASAALAAQIAAMKALQRK